MAYLYSHCMCTWILAISECIMYNIQKLYIYTVLQVLEYTVCVLLFTSLCVLTPSARWAGATTRPGPEGTEMKGGDGHTILTCSQICTWSVCTCVDFVIGCDYERTSCGRSYEDRCSDWKGGREERDWNKWSICKQHGSSKCNSL